MSLRAYTPWVLRVGEPQMPRASWCLPYGVLSAGNGGLREANFIRKHKSKAMRQSLAIPPL